MIGGTSLFGGEGGAFGTMLGAAIFAVLANILNPAGVSPITQQTVKGPIIVAAVPARDAAAAQQQCGFARRNGLTPNGTFGTTCLAVLGTAALGAVTALEAAGRLGEMIVVGIDGQESACEAIKKRQDGGDLHLPLRRAERRAVCVQDQPRGRRSRRRSCSRPSRSMPRTSTSSWGTGF